MRQSTGYLDGQECQLLEISMPKAGVPWKQEMQKAVAASEEGVCSRNGTMVIHGRTLGEHPELGAAITCALAKTGTGVYVGEATGLGSGVARCVHPGTGEQHTVGERHWYGHSKSSEAVRRQPDRRAAVGKRAAGDDGRTRAPGAREQPTVGNRPSARQPRGAHRESAGGRSPDTGDAGARSRRDAPEPGRFLDEGPRSARSQKQRDERTGAPVSA